MATLSRSLTTVLIIKICLLYGLWLVFFDTPRSRSHPSDTEVANALVGTPASIKNAEEIRR